MRSLDHEGAKVRGEREARRTRRTATLASRSSRFVVLRVFVLQTVSVFALLAFILLAPRGLAAPQTPATTAAFALPSVVIPPATQTVMGLTLRHNFVDVTGIDLVLTYDTTVADLLTIAKADLAEDWVLLWNESTTGTVKIGLAGATSLAGDLTLVNLTFAAVGVKGQSTAIAFSGALVNEEQSGVTTQDGQIAVDTPPVTDLSAGQVGGGIRLQWSHVGNDAQHYEVWRADNSPYFTPGAGSVCIADDLLPGGGLSYDDSSGGLGNPASNSFYVVLAVDANGRSSPVSNRVGEFDFGLQPGQ